MIAFQIAVVAFLAALSIFLATVEASFTLVKRRRLSQVGFHDESRVQLAQTYFDDPPRLLMPAHLGTYSAHVGMTVVITSLAFRLVDHWAMLTAFGIMMAYLLLFRLSMPYIFVWREPEATFLALLPAFHLWALALSPIVTRLRRRAVAVVDEPEEAPVPEVPPPPVQQDDEEQLVDALDRFSSTIAREVMTPRPDVVAIPAAAPVAALRRLMSETKYSRVPVYGKDLDEIQGVVEVRDLLDFQGDPASPASGLVRPVHLVPETKRIPDLLREMQARRVTFAVVIDEYGATAGIVTVEDIVEELVGEIKDEYDIEGDLLAVDPDGSVVADGRASIERLEQALETELSIDEEIDTVGGLVTSIFGQIPRAGERRSYRGFEVEVLAAEKKRVNRVRFRRAPGREPGVSEQAVEPFRAGFVTVVGRPNVGKSTLVNRLVGQKVAIVSDKPQTTRNRILAVVNRPGAQMVLFDTPGIHKPMHEMNRRMVETATRSIGQGDVVLWLVEVQEPPGPGDRFIEGLLRRAARPVVLAINKIDRVPKPRILPAIDVWQHAGSFEEIVPVSALQGDNVDRLEKVLLDRLPEGPALYPEDFLTDLPERFFVAEMVRERILDHTREEIPYVTGVVIEEFKEEDALVRIRAAILVERDNQKGILIGRGGSMLKRVGTEARQEIEALLGAKVFLGLFVKVREHWRENEAVLGEMGLGERPPHAED